MSEIGWDWEWTIWRLKGKAEKEEYKAFGRWSAYKDQGSNGADRSGAHETMELDCRWKIATKVSRTDARQRSFL